MPGGAPPFFVGLRNGIAASVALFWGPLAAIVWICTR